MSEWLGDLNDHPSIVAFIVVALVCRDVTVFFRLFSRTSKKWIKGHERSFYHRRRHLHRHDRVVIISSTVVVISSPSQVIHSQQRNVVSKCINIGCKIPNSIFIARVCIVIISPFVACRRHHKKSSSSLLFFSIVQSISVSSAYFFFHQSIYSSIHPSIHLLIHPSIHSFAHSSFCHQSNPSSILDSLRN